VEGGQGENSLVLGGSGGVLPVPEDFLDILWDEPGQDRLLRKGPEESK
jgi:hypothetical protein